LLTQSIRAASAPLARSARDLAPIILVLGLFQLLVVGAPPARLGLTLLGLLALLLGLTLLVEGLRMSLFPIGEGLAAGIAARRSLPLLLAFGFLLGYGSTIAEPALAVVADKAAAAATETGHLEADAARGFALRLRHGVAAAVGAGVVLGLVRLLRGWSISLMVLTGYGLATLLAAMGGPLVGLAFDAAAAATAVINIPLIAALGVGLASVIGGRDPLADGFGLVALATLMPVLAVMLGGLLVVLW
jgi:hypothetical protein